MVSSSKAPITIEQYIKAFPPRVRSILERIRETIRAAAPEATEVISYRMPAFKLHGIVVYFAAFKNHIGLYPPIRGDSKLAKAAARYAGEKGNLRFPIEEPIPYELIKQIVLHRAKQSLAKRAPKARKGPQMIPVQRAKRHTNSTAR
jgi:uncharacterized protein YdhG (YjbR/CyaY superfamily)